MKSLLLALPIIFGSVPAYSQYYYNQQQNCSYYRNVYDAYGNVIRSICVSNNYQPNYYQSQPNYYYQQRPQYYCRPVNTALGALLGGGIAASMSRGRGYAWSVPVGAAIGGAVIGCRQY